MSVSLSVIQKKTKTKTTSHKKLKTQTGAWHLNGRNVNYKK